MLPPLLLAVLPSSLPPAAAAAALRAADRRVCFLTHAWRSCVHPDPDGATLAALLRFLRDPLGAHVVGVFVDFACLHQPPRTAREHSVFKSASKVGTHVTQGRCIVTTHRRHAASRRVR